MHNKTLMLQIVILESTDGKDIKMYLREVQCEDYLDTEVAQDRAHWKAFMDTSSLQVGTLLPGWAAQIMEFL